MTETQQKTCSECGESKPLDEFYRHGRGKDGRISRCRDCKGAANREREAARAATAHEWIVAANVHVDTKIASRAHRFGWFRADEGMRIEALEASCAACRRPFEKVRDEPCAALIDNSHLIGGEVTRRLVGGEVRETRPRAKRGAPPTPVGRVFTPVGLSRRGLAGYSAHSDGRGRVL